MNAYLGVSFSLTEFFNRARMRSYFEWAGANLGNLVVIVADHLEGYNFQVFKRLGKAEAFEKAAAIGHQLEKHYSRAIPKELHSRITVLTASKLLRLPECEEARTFVEGAASHNREFRLDADAAITSLLSGKLEEAGLFGAEHEAAIEVLRHYVIEEIAIILYLAHVAMPRYPLAIFPYPPRDVITKVYDGRYGGAFFQLTRGEPFRFIQVAPRDIEVLKSQKNGHYYEALRHGEP